MRQRTTHGARRQQRGMGLAVAAALLLLGCQGEDPLVRQSQELIRDQMAQNPDLASHALAVMARTRTPFAKERIVEWIGSDHYPTALEAVRAIADDPPVEAREVLTRVYQEKKGLLRLNAAIALAKLDDESALATVRDEVLQGNTLSLPALRMVAQDPANTDELKSLLQKRVASKEASIRHEVYGLLGQLDQPWAVDMLRKSLASDRTSRPEILLALGQTKDPQVVRDVTKHVKTKSLAFAAVEALREIGDPSAVPALRELLDKTELDLVKAYAAPALWRLGEIEVARETVEPMLEHQDPAVRRALAKQLRDIEDPGVLEMLGRLIEDDDTEVRTSAMRSLLLREDPTSGSLFAGRLTDPNYVVSTIALDGLASLGGEGDVPQIEPLLTHGNPYVRISAANAILAIKSRAPAA